MLSKRTHWLICAGLAVCCIAIYAQTLAYRFIVYDDTLYVTENSEVQAGLSWSGIVWAFTTDRALYMHPLTWMSHMLDCSLYGLHPWGHHLTSIIFHCLNTALLFLVLAKMTRLTWPSALAAALWALHPLRVESVAWIAERKDVLSMFFWVLGMWAYLRYRERPGLGRYLAVAAMFVLGFLSKPMMVTFPCALLLLDYWPLGQIDRSASLGTMARQTGRLALEKLPLFALTAAVSVITYAMQAHGDNLHFMKNVSLPDRCANAVVVYVIYLAKAFWPTGLAVYYPHPIHRPLWQVALCAILLAAITAVCLRQMRRRPYLAVGWFWYLGTLVPVIELVQAGTFSHADRYTYIPMVGIAIMAAFGLNDLCAAGFVRTRFAAAAAAAVLAALTATAAHQASYWKNSETLFRHALAVTPPSTVSHNNLANGLYEQKRYDEAMEHCKIAIRLGPENNVPVEGMAMILYDLGRYEEALVKHREALALAPDDPRAQANLRRTLKALGRLDAAEEECRTLEAKKEKSLEDYCRLGTLHMTLGDRNAASDAFAAALKTSPDSPLAHASIGDVLAADGKFKDALDYYMKALKVEPRNTKTLRSAGTMLISLRRFEEAEQQYRLAVDIDPNFAEAHNDMGALLAETGRPDEAVECFRRAIALKPDFVQPKLHLGRLLAGQGKLGEALPLFEAAVAADPGSAPAKFNLAGVLLAMGRAAEAKVVAEKALELQPGDRNAEELMGQIRAALAAGSAPKEGKP